MSRTSHSPSTRARHKKWIKRAKGFRGRRSKIFKLAKEATLKAGQYAFNDRRKKKAHFRQLWQVRINAATRPLGLSYSRFINGLRQSNIGLDRKVLAQLATTHPETFKKLTDDVQAAISAKK
jgi:large subunit ribosomal protein L20